MSDTYTLHFKNFRSLRDTNIDIAPLTVIYGPNGSGKSSVIYGLLTLKNFLINPNQNLPSLFSYPSIALGGFQEVVHRHQESRSLSLSIGVSSSEDLSSTFTLTMEQSGGIAGVSLDISESGYFGVWPAGIEIPISIPYQGNQTVDEAFVMDVECHEAENLTIATGIPGKLTWNGSVLTAVPMESPSLYTDVFGKINRRINLPMEMARRTGFVPLRRGFSKPTYGLSNVTPNLNTEDEVASLLASPNERFRQYAISNYIEQIASRRIQTQAQVGTSTFVIDSIPIGQGTPASIVNEGFGINQLLYMLTICLHSPFQIVAIEEPEIHLHPSMVRNLAHAMIDIAANEDRNLIVSTHSEAFVVALLSQIAAGKVDVDKVSFYLAENRGGETILTKCAATADGQIEGGLEAFMAMEAEDLVNFLGLGR